MTVMLDRWLWWYWSPRDYGFRTPSGFSRGRDFGFVALPRRDADAAEGTSSVRGLLRIDGWIDWADFRISASGLWR